MEGYGQLLDVTASRVVRYDLTDISCLRDRELTAAQAEAEFDRITTGGGDLQVFETGGITRYGFKRLDALPARCSHADSAPDADPVLNFWVLWHAIRENYAFFQLRGVDWNAVQAKYRPQVDAVRGDDDLFALFRAMLTELNDMHVELKAGRRTFFTNGPVEELKALWLAGHPGRSWEETQSGYQAAVRRFIREDVLHGKARDGAQGTLTWGWAAPRIGYLNVAAMYLEPPPKPDGSPAEPIPLPEELSQVDRAMSRALVDLRGAKAMIVDARFNDGGADAFGLRIMGYFTRERFAAFTKQAVEGSGRTEPQTVYVEPTSGATYLGPVYFLQSGSTISAAEIFSLAMMAHPRATTIGTRTYGVLSDVLPKRLPNGWRIGLSNEIYTAADGKVYEGRGIPPEVQVPAPARADFHERLSADVESALALAAKAAAGG
jgi:carboxyl-terminal processing protease